MHGPLPLSGLFANFSFVISIRPRAIFSSFLFCPFPPPPSFSPITSFFLVTFLPFLWSLVLYSAFFYRYCSYYYCFFLLPLLRFIFLLSFYYYYYHILLTSSPSRHILLFRRLPFTYFLFTFFFLFLFGNENETFQISFWLPDPVDTPNKLPDWKEITNVFRFQSHGEIGIRE